MSKKIIKRENSEITECDTQLNEENGYTSAHVKLEIESDDIEGGSIHLFVNAKIEVSEDKVIKTLIRCRNLKSKQLHPVLNKYTFSSDEPLIRFQDESDERDYEFDEGMIELFKEYQKQATQCAIDGIEVQVQQKMRMY